MPVSGTYTIDPIHSNVGFSLRYGGVGWFGASFESPTGTLDVTDSGIKLVGSAPVESISIRLDPFRGHLFSADFFDTANHPEIGFTSTKVDLAESGKATVEGDLTVRGTTKPITASGTWEGPVEGLGGPRVWLSVETKIDRFDYGLAWGVELPGGGLAAGREVTLNIDLVLAPAE